LIGLLLALPYLWQHISFVLVLTCINILLASSMQISYSVGLWNFGVVGFMAVGAYTSGLLTSRLGVPFLAGFLAAGCTAAIISFAVGLIALRLRGVYFLLLTVGFTEVVRSAFVKWVPPRIYVPPMSIGGTALIGFSQYYFVVGVTVLILYILYRLESSRLGLTWHSIRQAEGLSRSVGVNIYRFKLMSFFISSFVAGLAGSYSAHIIGLVTPWGFTFRLMMYIAIWNFAGGISRFSGPILGALLLTLLVEPLSQLAYFESIAYAIVIIGIVLFLPGGLIGLPQKLRSLSAGRIVNAGNEGNGMS
jgi:branched-chain amino acid transport system permease protein